MPNLEAKASFNSHKSILPVPSPPSLEPMGQPLQGSRKPLRLVCCICCRNHLSQRLKPQSLHGSCRGQNQGAGAVIQGRCIGCRDGPILLKGRSQTSNAIHFYLGKLLVTINDDRVSLSLWNRNGNNLSVKLTLRPRFRSFLITRYSEIILCLTRNAVLFAHNSAQLPICVALYTSVNPSNNMPSLADRSPNFVPLRPLR